MAGSVGPGEEPGPRLPGTYRSARRACMQGQRGNSRFDPCRGIAPATAQIGNPVRTGADAGTAGDPEPGSDAGGTSPAAVCSVRLSLSPIQCGGCAEAAYTFEMDSRESFDGPGKT